MIRSFRNRRMVLCLLASLALHMLFLWSYQRWAAEPVQRVLRPERFELAPALEPERFEPVPRATVPEVVMEQLRLAELMEAQLPEAAPPPEVALESLAPDAALEAEAGLDPDFLPGDTVSYETALTDLYRRKLLELRGRRIMVLPLADTTSEAGRRRSRAREIIDRAIEAMGGLARLQAIRDKRVEVEKWDRRRHVWEPIRVASYLRGQRYRLDLAPRLARGYDGRRSWYLYYGLLMPGGDERPKAERWDFLSRFRGDGVVVEYVGTRQLHFPTLDAVRVIDTKFGRHRLAYFDRKDGLLYAEVLPCSTTTYRQYRETQGVLTPFEVWGRPHPDPECGNKDPLITRFRWHTELNMGLTADLFEVPEPVSWEPELVRISVFEHAPEPPGGPAALRLLVEDLDPGIYLVPLHTHLIDTYLKRKLQTAGVLAGSEPPEWRLIWRVEDMSRRPWEIAVHVQSLRDDALWSGMVRYWPPSGRRLDDLVADSVTWEVILKASAGIGKLLEARGAAGQPGRNPEAGE